MLDPDDAEAQRHRLTVAEFEQDIKDSDAVCSVLPQCCTTLLSEIPNMYDQFTVKAAGI